ncbi:hypothetical protein CKM354_001196000 [Cercospora kikuchii]|uniref:Uncharacterized protein n=1 Tax=Cercospora kikuchii TaxID=84275 RepID=A0A9P3FKL5_9PEZI|nr:uncharacterized protein CKM354_001196000 [Cercospora kikuchii]GIZ48917.1 hypothetical protein CKM354_001196000 [Cercospora kikuchii]
MYLKNLATIMLFGAGATAAPFDKRAAEAEALAAIPPQARNVRFGPYGPESLNYVPGGYHFPNTMPGVNRGGRSGVRPLPVTTPEKRAIPPEEARNLPFGPYGPDPLDLLKDVSPYRYFPNPMPRVNNDNVARIRPLPFTIPEKRAISPGEAGKFLFGPYEDGYPRRYIQDPMPWLNRDSPLHVKRNEAMDKAMAVEARIAEVFPGYRPRVPFPKNGVGLAVCGLYIGSC